MENKEEKAVTQFQESVYSLKLFEHAQRVAVMLSKSDMIPKAYQNRVDNCMVAIEMATRNNSSPLMVMQNLHIIQGRPSWSSTYIIASINSSGRFSSKLKFRNSGKDDDYGYEAYATEGDTEVTGPKVTWKMVKAEGWLDKAGSKWKTMPELMFQYRAAAFFGRLHTPEIMMGMQTQDEAIDISHTEVNQEVNEQDRKLIEENRLVKLIKAAETIEQLNELSQYVQEPQLDLFESRKQELTEKK